MCILLEGGIAMLRKFMLNRIVNKLISSILVVNHENKEIELLVLECAGITEIRGIFFVEYICQDLDNYHYSILISEHDLHEMLKTDDIMKHPGEAFIRKTIR